MKAATPSGRVRSIDHTIIFRQIGWLPPSFGGPAVVGRSLNSRPQLTMPLAGASMRWSFDLNAILRRDGRQPREQLLGGRRGRCHSGFDRLGDLEEHVLEPGRRDGD